jgi:hypothetical protein
MEFINYRQFKINHGLQTHPVMATRSKASFVFANGN